MESIFHSQNFTNIPQSSITQASMFSPGEQEQSRDKEVGEYKVVGQLWNAYIILEATDALYYICLLYTSDAADE